MSDDSALVTLMREDGVAFPSGDEAQKKVLCMFHDEKTPSMNVNMSEGLYHCFGCGAQGTVWNYLLEARGYDLKNAGETLERMGHTRQRVQAERKRGEDVRARRNEQKKGRPKRGLELMHAADVIATHDYYDEDGRHWCTVARYEPGRKLPKVMPHTPCNEHGGWWYARPDHEGLPDEDRLDGKIPLYGLGELMRGVEEQADRQIWVVEGEKCADAINQLPRGGPGEPRALPPAVTLMGGSKTKKDLHDLEPLHHRRVLLIADTDQPGRDFMKALARLLYRRASEVRICLPPGEGGYDVADARAEGGWKGIVEWVSEHVLEYSPPAPEEAIDTEAAGWDIGDNDYFRVIGTQGDKLIVQEKATHTLTYLPRNRVSDAGNQQMLAPDDFWRSMAGKDGLSKTFSRLVGDELLNAGRRKGEIAPEETFGLGAASIDDQVVYHIGNELLVQKTGNRALETSVDLTEAGDQFDMVFLPRSRIRLRDDPSWDEYGRELHDAILEYRWRQRSHGQIFLGWMVASLIGGALEHRPAIWLVGSRSSGKTYLLEKVLDPMHGNFRRSFADPSEAGVASKLGSDSLPVTIDEFEPEGERWRAILNLMRQATSGTAERVRGTASGGSMSWHPRFSLMLSSIDQPKLKASDESRIWTIQLAAQGVDNWQAVNRRILLACDPQRMSMIRTGIIRHAPEIVRAAQSMALKAQTDDPGLESREAMIAGALTAGCHWLSGRRMNEWAVLQRPAGFQASEEEAHIAPLLAVLSLSDKVGNSVLTLSEMLHEGWVDAQTGKLITMRVTQGGNVNEGAQAQAKRMGFRFHKGRLAMALNHDPLTALMRHTRFPDHDLDKLVMRIEGAEIHTARSGNRGRLDFGRQQRFCVLFPEALAVTLGILDQDEVTDPQGSIVEPEDDGIPY